MGKEAVILLTFLPRIGSDMGSSSAVFFFTPFMSKLLTIVIPAYNMHDYIRRCLDSICVESVMEEVQVIVVNDGSTDDTSKIAHEYERRYPHYFQVIDKANGNYGSCMNAALPLAEGKYFRTLDADDWYDTEAFVHLVADMHHTDADLIITEKVNHYLDHPQKTMPFLFSPGLIMCQDVSFDDIHWEDSALREMMGVMFLTTRTSLLRSVQMHWSEGVYYTDFEYITIPLFLAKTVRLAPLPVYQYLLGRDGQSVDYSFSLRNKHSYVVVLNAVLDRFEHSQFVSQGAAALFRLKLQLLIRVIYDLFFQHRFVLDPELKSLDSRVCLYPQLRSFTDGMEGFRGHRYAFAYRHNRLLHYLYCLDYRLRTNSILRKLLNKA